MRKRWLYSVWFYLVLFVSVRSVRTSGSGSQFMLRLQHLSGTFADDDARGHSVPGSDARHNRSVGDTKVLDSVDFEATVHYRHCVSAHWGSTGLMPICDAGVPDEVFESGAFEIAWHHLALHERSECGGVTDLAADFHAGYRGLQ